MLTPATFPRPTEMRRGAVLSAGQRSVTGYQMLIGGYDGESSSYTPDISGESECAS